MFLNDIMNLQRELDELFDRPLFPFSTYKKGVYPAINIFESDGNLKIKAEAPGMEKKDINIELKGDSIVISGERKPSLEGAGNYHRREIRSGKFNRQFQLPYRVDTEKISANLEDGILTIDLERAEEDKPRKISIK
ncbi:MAG: Hsp20/alpha crystallin family protein [Oligoflexales bacterium]|nr:Hsp20/alpha crystallin family protein [Oligoflexales bacterium]